MPSKCAATLLATAILATTALSALSQQPATGPAPLPDAVPPGRPVIGLALEGGGALGMAHIGVLRWLEENHVPVDRLAGTSMGALVGALYADGDTPAQLKALAESDAFNSVFTLQTPYVDLSYRRRQDSRQVPTIVLFGLKHKPALRNALLADRGVVEFLTTNMLAYNSRELDFNRTPIPFRCVATDLNSLQPITFSAGPMPQAVRASISIPGIFPPVQAANGHYLIDGGILDNLPTDVLKHDLHAETVIAVHLQEAAVSTPDTSSIIGVLNRAFDAGTESNVNQALHIANIVINIPISNFSSTDYSRKNAEKLIEAGYQAAEQSRAALLPLALDDHGWKAYLAARDSRRLAPPGNLREVRVEGSVPAAQRQVQADFKPLQAQPITAAKTINALKPIQSNGDLSATYETFAPPPNNAVPNTGNPDTGNLDTGIQVRLNNDPIGPPYLLLGGDLAAETSNITRAEIAFRLVDQNLGGYGSELRSTARLGYMTDLSAEYYRLLTPSGFFLQPSAGIVREPVYIWANQKRVAELMDKYEHGNFAKEIFQQKTQIGRALPHEGWQAQYSFDLTEVAPADLEMSNHWTSSRAESRFTRMHLASIVLPEGFASLNGTRMTMHHQGRADAMELRDPEDYRAALADLFRIVLSGDEVKALGVF